MESKNIITKNTELKPKDLIRNMKGETFRINSIFGSKDNFRIHSIKDIESEKTPLYLFVSKDALIQGNWEKVEDVKSSKHVAA
jgi:hypothetical protein